LFQPHERGSNNVGVSPSSGYRVDDPIVLKEHREAWIVPTRDRWRTDRVVLGDRRAELGFTCVMVTPRLGFSDCESRTWTWSSTTMVSAEAVLAVPRQ
jgi:hypothetical protein